MKKKWVAICLTTLLLFGLLIGCAGDQNSESPLPTSQTMDNLTTPPEPARTPSDSDTPPEPARTPTDSDTSPEPARTPTDSNTSPEPARTPSGVNQGLIEYPDVYGFTKIDVTEDITVYYIDGPVTMTMQYLPATQEQLDQLAQGGGASLELLFGQMFIEGTASSKGLIDLPGLNRKALELDIREPGADGFEYIGLIIPSQGQVLTILGRAQTSNLQVLQNGFDQLIQKLRKI